MDLTNAWLKARTVADGALKLAVPLRRDDQWMATYVDEPRFGWDWDGLERGFLAPVHEFNSQHPVGLRTLLLDLLLTGKAPQQCPSARLIAAIECQYLSSIMLDMVANTHDLPRQDESLPLPPPVWVTVAYNLRQLGVLLSYEEESALTLEDDTRLGEVFGEYLVRQGLARTADLGIRRLSGKLDHQGLLGHLLSTEPSASFELVGHTAVAVAGQPQAGIVLAATCRHLGAALRLDAISQSVLDSVGEEPVVSDETRLPEAVLRVDADLAALAAEQMCLALGFAKRSLPGANQAVLRFIRLVAPRLYEMIGVSQ
ncbi:hypothetical protein [Propionibacterium acidifaciens]|uniref:hypothetical protein n=2 Tax=Propionibacterium acidifaciens TaxID=556499 RepID=UPI0004038938|nr:hypothetical protein [Propionibacterium acidifaciens]